LRTARLGIEAGPGRQEPARLFHICQFRPVLPCPDESGDPASLSSATSVQNLSAPNCADAAARKTAGLKLSDLERPQTKQFIAGVEQSVVHYGSSTGFFGRKMFANGPEYLSAAVLYESMVVESYSQNNLAFPVVAIYPKEGTFWSDHPVGIVDREWVSPEHREAAKIYIQYLLARPQQEKAIQYGFRPASVKGRNPHELSCVARESDLAASEIWNFES
jgi:ABC-type Fe3+ transport system substrate-binding protein